MNKEQLFKYPICSLACHKEYCNYYSALCLFTFARLEQFNDILLQENSIVDEISSLRKISSPLVELPTVDLLLEKKSLIAEPLKVHLSFILKLNEFKSLFVSNI